MSLLREIQSALMQPKQDIGPILLKLRFLASRLGSNLLEEWVRYEADGYPPDVEIPAYRKVGVAYSATFTGPFGSGIKNAPIPPYLIQKFAGDGWATRDIRQSVSSIDDLVSTNDGGVLHISTGNLMLLLQDNVYEGYACNSVTGQMSKASLVEIQNAVRARVLELTIQIEKAVPAASQITIGPPPDRIADREVESVTHMTNQIIYGNYTNVSNAGHGAHINVSIGVGDQQGVTNALKEAGIPEQDAREISNIFASEQPISKEEPFGKKAQSWIAKNVVKAANGTWKIGVGIATQVLTEAALRYYGFK